MAVTRSKFHDIEKRHGMYCSWALWAEPQAEDDHRTGGLGNPIFEHFSDEDLTKLNPNLILVGFNKSTGPVDTLMNFHSDDQHIGKLRYALRDSPLWGAYMTDLLKGYSNPSSSETMAYLRQHPNELTESLKLFRDELTSLGVSNPILFALGKATYNLMKKHLGKEFQIVKLIHYSHYISNPKEENYKKLILPHVVDALNCEPW